MAKAASEPFDRAAYITSIKDQLEGATIALEQAQARRRDLRKQLNEAEEAFTTALLKSDTLVGMLVRALEEGPTAQ